MGGHKAAGDAVHGQATQNCCSKLTKVISKELTLQESSWCMCAVVSDWVHVAICPRITR